MSTCTRSVSTRGVGSTDVMYTSITRCYATRWRRGHLNSLMTIFSYNVNDELWDDAAHLKQGPLKHYRNQEHRCWTWITRPTHFTPYTARPLWFARALKSESCNRIRELYSNLWIVLCTPIQLTVASAGCSYSRLKLIKADKKKKKEEEEEAIMVRGHKRPAAAGLGISCKTKPLRWWKQLKKKTIFQCNQCMEIICYCKLRCTTGESQDHHNLALNSM